MALTLQQIRDKADAILGPISTAIQSAQATWILTHQNYWQGQRTFGTIPVDGADVVPNGSVKPSGAEDASWTAFGITLPATLSCTLAVDNHSGPLGKGYTMYALATFNGRVFRRCLGIGFYGFTQNWTEIPVGL
jgi:hypothetical protein